MNGNTTIPTDINNLKDIKKNGINVVIRINCSTQFFLFSWCEYNDYTFVIVTSI